MASGIKALAVAENAEVLERTAEVLRRSGMEVETCRGVESLPEGRIRQRLIVCGLEHPDASIKPLTDRMRSSAQAVALVAEDATLEAQVRWFSIQKFNHVIKLTDEGWQRLGITAQKLATGEIFGVEKYLPEGTEIKYVRLVESRGRDGALQRIVEYAEAAKFRRAQRQHIVQACEELLMNALYNAPVDDTGKLVFADVGPKERMEMSTPRPVSVRFGAAGDVFGVAVRDRFGTLNKTTFVQYLNKCLHSDEQIDRKTSGAGLGLYQVASRANEYINNVAPGYATEAVALFHRRFPGERPLNTVGFFEHPGGGLPGVIDVGDEAFAGSGSKGQR